MYYYKLCPATADCDRSILRTTTAEEAEVKVKSLPSRRGVYLTQPDVADRGAAVRSTSLQRLREHYG